MSTVIVDTGVANLHSVTSALARLGADFVVSDDPARVSSADRLILPGVGSAKAGMAALRTKNLVEPLSEFERPMLGICLGMQLMFHGLGESGGDGLGLLEGDISELGTGELPLPHMGWNTLDDVSDDPLLFGIAAGEHVYFVHSFAANVSGQTLAKATYGQTFSAAARSGNRMGCQFHPERSGTVGAKILQNFQEL